MDNLSHMKITELSRMIDIPKLSISRFFKRPENDLDDFIEKNSGRVIGLKPNGVSACIKELIPDSYNKGGVVICANLCGGTAKTTGVVNLSYSARRVYPLETPIILIDGDSQASLSQYITGSPSQDETTLNDYLSDIEKEKKAKKRKAKYKRQYSINDIINDIGNNMYIIKSNLDLMYFQRLFSSSIQVKETMKNLYDELFAKFGDKAIIFQDNTPQLTTLFGSSVCALYDLDPKKYMRAIIVPMRTDSFAMEGASKIISEVEDLIEAFNFKNNVPVITYFSSIDKRINSTGQAIKNASENPVIVESLADCFIRYSADIPKHINNQTNSNVFLESKSSKAKDDYSELLHFIIKKIDSK